MKPILSRFIFSILFRLNDPSVMTETLNCSFEYTKYNNDTLYTCNIKDNGIFVNYNPVISKIDGIHFYLKTNEHVEFIKVLSSDKFNFMPENLGNLFKNVSVIEISNTTLKKIKTNDLRTFTKLKILNLSSNQLEVIEADSFKFNTDLEVIDLRANNISHINPRVFTNLAKLKELLLDDNKCKEEIYDAHNSEHVKIVVKQIEMGDCSKDPMDEKKSEDEILRAEIQSLKLENEKLKLQNERLNESLRLRYNELLSENEVLTTNLKRLNETLTSDQDVKYRELKAKISENEVKISKILRDFQNFRISQRSRN